MSKVQTWNPESADVERVELFDTVRRSCPVAYSDKLGWSIFGYDDVVAAADDFATFSSIKERTGSNLAASYRAIPLELDPPEHTQFREMLRPLFSNTRIARLEPSVRDLAKRDIAAMVAKGTTDIKPAFTGPFPVRVLCMFIGWHENDWVMIKERSDDVRNAMIDGNDERLAQGFARWTDYITPVLEDRLKNPKDDASTWLQQQSVDGRPLTRQEVIRIIRLSLVAGHGTTSASMAHIIAYLATHPEEQEALRQKPSDLPAAMEEILRWSGPLSLMERTATRDTELGGCPISKGDRVTLMYAAANRDERAFPDAHTCIVNRKPKGHLVFGTGPHRCLGASLARLEMRIAIGELLSQTRSFELTAPLETDEKSWPTREFKQVLIKFDPA